jgi:hypothetical protein
VRCCFLLLVLSFLAGCATPDRALSRFEFTQPQMGVPFRIVLYAKDQPAADRAATAAFARAAGVATPSLDLMAALASEKAMRAGLYDPKGALPFMHEV